MFEDNKINLMTHSSLFESLEAATKLTLTFLCLQFDQMSVQASQFGDELRMVKGEVAEVNRLISRLQSEIEAVKAQVQPQEIFCLVEGNRSF